MKLFPFIKILRIPNMLILGASVALGMFLSHTNLALWQCLLLILAAICCAGFGNVVNDVADVNTDAISHTNRVLPKKEMSLVQARLYAGALALVALIAAFCVSPLHGIAVIFPVVLLWLYASLLKGTPLSGNILVSLLVGYGPIFGGLGAPDHDRLWFPALLAFLLSCCREIVKDVQDVKGDSAAGIVTTAILAQATIKKILAVCALAYVLLLFLPVTFKQFGLVYALICAIIVLPIHFFWIRHIYKSDLEKSASKISALIKWEMVAGLIALLADEIIKRQ